MRRYSATSITTPTTKCEHGRYERLEALVRDSPGHSRRISTQLRGDCFAIGTFLQQRYSSVAPAF
jgi:hypothetical protein